ncbi:unnamed protein product, partial [Allacma fusca]
FEFEHLARLYLDRDELCLGYDDSTTKVTSELSSLCCHNGAL